MTPFGKAYQQTGYGDPERGASEAETYEHALEFLDRFIEEAAERSLPLRHRLDAQSLLWAIQDEEPVSTVTPVEDEETVTKLLQSLDQLASELMWEPDRLRMVIHGLEDKGQVIFQGPPGTGKTYVARRIAQWYKSNRAAITRSSSSTRHTPTRTSWRVSGPPAPATARWGTISSKVPYLLWRSVPGPTQTPPSSW